MDHEAQYLDMITKHVASFFLCRRKSCLHIWRSVDWLKHSVRWQFHCPACGELYVPWSMKQKIHVKANLVWITRVRGNAPDNMCIKGRGERRYEVTPTTWADTTVASLTNTLKEVHAEVATSISDLHPQERMRHVISLVQESPVQSYLQHYRLSPDVQQVARRKRLDITAQLEGGVWGTHLRQLNTTFFDEPVDQKDILRAFIALNIIMQTACRTDVASLTTSMHRALSEELRTDEGEEQG